MGACLVMAGALSLGSVSAHPSNGTILFPRLMSGTLYVVATPIGNLEDITLRAIRVLREADVIAAEDTRRTAKLLAHHGIATRMLSFHAHNTRTRLPQLIERLRAGDRIAVVTDAGTPGVSDPGVELVAACHAAGIRVEPIPGASAPLTAAIASGFPLEKLTILGFVPTKAKDRSTFIAGVASMDGTVTLFEAPHRISSTLREIADALGERPIMVGRELTKLHEQFVIAPARDIIGQIPEAKGEFTIVVGPVPRRSVPASRPSDAEIAAEFGRVANTEPGGRRAAIASVARRHGMRPKEVYSIVERQGSYVERPQD
jgi:16S rRNA (cytidine1402-2'-O)-methyltransferase